MDICPRHVVICVVLVLLTGCGKSAPEPRAASSPATASPAASPVSIPGKGEQRPGDPYPTFQEGGTLSLTVQGKPISVPLTLVTLANTDSGYPDFMEIEGAGTYMCALIDPKMPDGEGPGYYQPIVGRALPLNVPVDIQQGAREITVPGQGKYPVTGGNLVMEKFQCGMNGRDYWEGRVEVIVQTAQGPVTIPGTFAFCVIPTW